MKLKKRNKTDFNKSLNHKNFFVGISFSSINTIDSAAAVLDSDYNVISLVKLPTYHDLEFYLKNLQGIKDSLIAVSLPKNEIMISNKWKYTSRIYHAVNFNSPIKSRDGWARRYSHKGVEFFKVLKSQNYDICRFEVANSKHGLGCNEAYLERTPADCKALQTALKMKLGMEELPTNMLPVAQLEAILGAYTAGEAFFGNNAKKLFEYETLDVIGFEI